MISDALSIGRFLLDLAGKTNPNNQDIKAVQKAADFGKRAYDVTRSKSIHQSASKALISPMVGIENTLIHKEYANDLMQVVQLRDIIAVLTHLKLRGTAGMGLTIGDALGEINPARSGFMALAGVEALKDSGIEEEKELKKVQAQYAATGINQKELNEYTPLAVGKVVNAQIYNDAGVLINFPLTFRQIVIPMDYPQLLNTFSAVGIDESYAGRALKKKVGMISMPEYLSGSDVVKEKFRIANNDLTRYYKESLEREEKNKMAAFKTGVMSMNSLANAFIISQESIDQIELEVGRRLSHRHGRNSIFEKVMANVIIVVNEDRGLFTFHSIASDMPEVYTRKDLKVKAGGGNDANTLEDLVKLLGGR